MSAPTVLELKRAIEISEQIASLQAELANLLSGKAHTAAVEATQAPARGRKKGKMSAAGRARVAAAQKARWAKLKAASPSESPAAKSGNKKKRKLSPEARARIVAAVKARWAKAKA